MRSIAAAAPRRTASRRPGSPHHARGRSGSCDWGPAAPAPDNRPSRADAPGPHGPGVVVPGTRRTILPRVTRPTLTGTPDAVPAVEVDEILLGDDLDLMDRWLAQADPVEIAEELPRLPR